MDIHKAEDEVFAKYAELCEKCKAVGALPDGCPEPALYEAAPFRALFVLKEAYGWNEGNGSPRDLRHFARDGGHYKTWGNLARWSALMSNPASRFEDVDARNRVARDSHLSGSSFINLKKVPGGKRSNSRDIAAFAMAHKDFLQTQLAIYRPHVTIACGTFSVIRDLYAATEQPKPKIDNGFFYFRDPDLGIVVDFYHPQYLGYSREAYLGMLRSNLRFHFPNRFTQA